MKVRILLLLFLAFAWGNKIQAQTTTDTMPPLPKLYSATKDGVNFIYWNNPYTSGVKSIKIERSADSNYNFKSIFIQDKVKAGRGTYADEQATVGNNFYRIIVTFTSDVEWISDRTGQYIDSATYLKRKQMVASGNTPMVNPPANIPIVKPDTVPVAPPLKISRYVYSDPFSGNINISIEDALTNQYQLIFYNKDHKEVLRIDRVDDPFVILDKHNFQYNGIYPFELNKNKQPFDSGEVMIN